MLMQLCFWRNDDTHGMSAAMNKHRERNARPPSVECRKRLRDYVRPISRDQALFHERAKRDNTVATLTGEREMMPI
jgi:hypothetical protein